jgi:hypothetical protein
VGCAVRLIHRNDATRELLQQLRRVVEKLRFSLRSRQQRTPSHTYFRQTAHHLAEGQVPAAKDALLPATSSRSAATASLDQNEVLRLARSKQRPSIVSPTLPKLYVRNGRTPAATVRC